MSAVKREINYYPSIPLQEEEKIREINTRKRKLKRLKRERMLFKLSCILFVTIFLVTSLFVLNGYSNISEMRMNITNLEKRRSELDATKNSLVSELEEAKGSIKIREEAMYKLSMDYPEEDQVVYLSTNGGKGN